MTLLSHVEDRLQQRDGRIGDWARRLADVRERAAEDRVAIVAAGLAFYVLLSLVPALVATVAVYSWVRDAASLTRRIESWTVSFPDEVQRLLVGQLLEVAGMTGTGAGVGLVVGVIASFWAASKGSRALMVALNIAYDIEEDRQSFRRRGIAVAVVVLGVLLIVFALAFVDVGASSTGRWWSTLTSVVFWPLVLAGVAAATALAYRFGPNRPDAAVEWLAPGVIVATAVFAVATTVVAVYVATIGIGHAYGALGAFVAGGLWLLVVCWGLLIGAYVNVELDGDDHVAR